MLTTNHKQERALKKLALVLLALLGLSGPAAAVTFKTQPLSQTWLFTGTCNGQDQVYSWVLAGGVGIGSWHISPWMPMPIGIFKIEMQKISGGPHTWFMIGNNAQGDVAGRMNFDKNEARVEYPAGMLSVFPSAGTARPSDYIDLHGSCTGGGAVNIWVDIYYVEADGPFDPPAPPPPAALCATFDTLNPADKSGNVSLTGGNLVATSNGANAHSLVRAITGIAPNTGKKHFEATWSGQGSGGTPINILGMQDGAAATSTPVGNGGTGVGVGYNPSNGVTYASGFTPGTGAGPAAGQWHLVVRL
jgi:hypothetical protein